ncbi:unnamed protein product [Albugo candida]|nr:unnamed protein product [Albugo candida]|eukprot:CCI11507.1 unnamed protein product [Albugo candida]
MERVRPGGLRPGLRMMKTIMSALIVPSAELVRDRCVFSLDTRRSDRDYTTSSRGSYLCFRDLGTRFSHIHGAYVSVIKMLPYGKEQRSTSRCKELCHKQLLRLSL